MYQVSFHGESILEMELLKKNLYQVLKVPIVVCCQCGECSGAQGPLEKTSQDPVGRTEEEGENMLTRSSSRARPKHPPPNINSQNKFPSFATHFQVNVKFITSVPGSGVQVPVQHLSPSPSEILLPFINNGHSAGL